MLLLRNSLRSESARGQRGGSGAVAGMRSGTRRAAVAERATVINLFFLHQSTSPESVRAASDSTLNIKLSINKRSHVDTRTGGNRPPPTLYVLTHLV